ncbi:hypothetical protein MILUP08_42074 [Micromonospora lupini str. Lupac 08]|uniref:Uncharacterized protein n=1 Tax=Micromonospora lupini str. Lupac 08 TaxID=1150864 RepID=I0L007_9ACTN|nr:hypothetical protein MILUP08_42074 [Micromonospora lupini str. Lupac 08]
MALLVPRERVAQPRPKAGMDHPLSVRSDRPQGQKPRASR